MEGKEYSNNILNNVWDDQNSAIRVTGMVSGGGDGTTVYLMGSSGTSGTSGISIKGDKGNNGTSGTSGDNGFDGWDGTSGTSGISIKGDKGSNGTSGVSIIGEKGTSGTSGVDGNYFGTSGTSGSGVVPVTLLVDDVGFEYRDLVFNTTSSYVLDLEPSYLYSLSALTFRSDGNCIVNILHNNEIILSNLNISNKKSTFYFDNIITRELSMNVSSINATWIQGKLKNRIII